jgi:glycosyltransferase involved in cell wall biosynthesis
MKKVAIITRTKNRGLFLKRAIQSVAKQSYKDYVHVIVNDGGNPDAISDIVDKLEDAVKSNIQVFHRKSPSNAPDTIFNECIDKVGSEYVAIHDDDDTWHRDFLKIACEKLDAGAEGVLVRTDRVYENVTEEKLEKTKQVRYMPEVSVVSLYRQYIDNQLTPIAFVYRRSAYEAVGKYNDKLSVAGDWEFGIRFLKKYKVEFVDPGYALAFYHRRANVKDDSFSNHNHEVAIVEILNEYLRNDLEKGSLGDGYIMNKLYYERKNRNMLIERAVPNVILKRFKKK